MTSKLYTVAKAVDAIASAFEIDRRKALSEANLPNLRFALNVAYAGIQTPVHATVQDATAALLTQALRHNITAHTPEKAAAAVAADFAAFHGVDFALRPYNLIFPMLAQVRDRGLGIAEVSHWLKNTVEAGDPSQRLQPAGGPLPLSSLIATVSHPVTEAQERTTARDDFFVKALGSRLTCKGGQLLAPLRRRRADGEPWRTNQQLRSDAQHRFDKASVLIALADDASGGVGSEVRTAIGLGLTTLLVKSTPRRSPWFDDPSVVVLPYGQKIASVPSLVETWLLNNQWVWANSVRTSEDRTITTLPRRSMLAAAWRRLSPTQQEALARTMRLECDHIESILASGVGMAMAGHDELEMLHMGLDVPLPGPSVSAIEFDTSELEALAFVSHERGVGVEESFKAANDLLIELSTVGHHRHRLDIPLWRKYFDTVELGKGPLS